MAPSTTLILGAGFGGVSCANTLRSLLPDSCRIVLVDKGSAFSFGAAKTWVALGLKKPAEILSPLFPLSRKGIELVRADVLRIDANARAVETSAGSFQADHLVVALGADTDMASIPGLAQTAQSFYTLDGAIRLRDALPGLKRGRLVLLIPRAPFKCPPGPYEGAFLLHDYFKDRGIRDQIEFTVATVEPRPMATAGPDIGDFVMEELKARGIDYLTQKRTTSVDPQTRTIAFEGGSSMEFDFLIAVDPHVCPKAVVDSGLAKPGGWIPVDSKTLAVADRAGVWAIGDVASVPLPGRFRPEAPLVLPKAGVMADAQGKVVARQIAAKVLGSDPGPPFDGRGFCFLEMGDMHAVKGEGDFFAMPNPTMKRRVPDMGQYEDKKQWMADWVRENLTGRP